MTEMKTLIHSVLLLIALLMSTTGADEVIYAQVGETVTLTPPGGLAFKNYIYWYFNSVNGLQLAWRNTLGGNDVIKDVTWKDRLSWSDSSLIIRNIQQENFGTFLFQQRGVDAVTTYKILKLEVTAPTSPLLPGDRLTLTCNAEKSPPGSGPTTIHWLNPQEEKEKKNRIDITATSQHNGQWFCVVTHANKEKKAKVSVTVLGLTPVPPQYTSTFKPLTVPCSLLSHISWEQVKAKAIKQVYWNFVPEPGSMPQRLYDLSLEDPLAWKPDQSKDLVPSPDLKKGNMALTRNLGRKEDRGYYTCALEFKNGVTLNSTVHVDVLQITAYPGTELISGQKLNLTCGLGSSLPSDLEVKWFLPKTSSFSLPSDPHPADLLIPEVGTGDSGKWRCELRQGATRLTSAEIKLKIEPLLSVWMLVVICSVAVIVILLIVLAIIFCRRRQRRMRHLRHRMCQCKTPKPKGFYRT